MDNKYIILYSNKPVFEFRNKMAIDNVKELSNKKTVNEIFLDSIMASLDKSTQLQDREIKIITENMTASQALDMKLNNPHVSDVFRAMPVTIAKPSGMRYYVPGNEIPQLWGIDAVNAHNSIYTGAGIKVAVLDTGIDMFHPAFYNIKDKIKTQNFTGEHDTDRDGHGTHCAGTLFGSNVDGLRIGIARGIDEAFIGKVIGHKHGDISVIIPAMEAAGDFGANIICMSFEFNFPEHAERSIRENPEVDIKQILSMSLNAYRKNVNLFEECIEAMQEKAERKNKPLIIIAAAGNQSNRPIYDISVCAPAVSKGIISVGALQQKDSEYIVPPFSNSEPTLSAPGYNILSAAMHGELAYNDGTSMAVPHVAGVAALWGEKLIKEGQFKTSMLRSNLEASCQRSHFATENKVYYGGGIVQAPLQ